MNESILDALLSQYVTPYMSGNPQSMGPQVPQMAPQPQAGPQMGPPQPQMGAPAPQMPQDPSMAPPGPQMPQGGPPPVQEPLADVESALMSGMNTPESEALTAFEAGAQPFERKWQNTQEQDWRGLAGGIEWIVDKVRAKKMQPQRDAMNEARTRLTQKQQTQMADQKYKDAKKILMSKDSKITADQADAAARLYAQGEDLEKVMPDHMTEYQKQRLALDRENMEAQARRHQATALAEAAGLDQDIKDNALKMHDRVAPTLKSYNKTQMTMQRLLNLEELYGDNPGPAQINAMYDFIKSIDPDSVVREGEVRLTQEGQGYVTMLQNVIGKARDDQVLPVEFYTQIVNVAQSINEELQKGYAKELGNYYNLNEKHGLPQDLVFGGDEVIDMARMGAQADWDLMEAQTLPEGWTGKPDEDEEEEDVITVTRIN